MTLNSALSAWLPTGVHFAVRDPRRMYPLIGSEQNAVCKAIAKRQMEFSAGRDAARAALASLGTDPCEISVGPRRTPVWPHGVCGSITHSKSLCIAALARREEFASIGIDAEPDVPLKDNLRKAILTESEQGVSAHEAIQIFSMKEALFKMLYPVTDTWFGFHAAKRTPGGLELTEQVGAFAVGTGFQVITIRHADHVISFCSLQGCQS